MAGANAPAVLFGARPSTASPGGAMPTVNNRGHLFWARLTTPSQAYPWGKMLPDQPFRAKAFPLSCQDVGCLTP